MRRFAVLVLLLAAMPLVAQGVSGFEPANPTAADFITAIVITPNLGYDVQPVVIEGSEIRIALRAHGVLPAFGRERVRLGHLPEGIAARRL